MLTHSLDVGRLHKSLVSRMAALDAEPEVIAGVIGSDSLPPNTIRRLLSAQGRNFRQKGIPIPESLLKKRSSHSALLASLIQSVCGELDDGWSHPERMITAYELYRFLSSGLADEALSFTDFFHLSRYMKRRGITVSVDDDAVPHFLPAKPSAPEMQAGVFVFD